VRLGVMGEYVAAFLLKTLYKISGFFFFNVSSLQNNKTTYMGGFIV
jgi:hypothetical protein